MTLWICCFMYGWGYTLDNILGIKLRGWRVTVFVILMDPATEPSTAVMPIYSLTSSIWGGSFHPLSLPQLATPKSSYLHNNAHGLLLSLAQKRWADLPAGDQWAQMRMRWGPDAAAWFPEHFPPIADGPLVPTPSVISHPAARTRVFQRTALSQHLWRGKCLEKYVLPQGIYFLQSLISTGE